MPSPPYTVSRIVGGVLFVAMLLLVVGGMLVKEPWPNDELYLLVRWPVWLILGVGAPLLVLRVALWRRRRAQRGPPTATGAQ
jgi:membrane protein DedA with SNARE-associated domain